MRMDSALATGVDDGDLGIRCVGVRLRRWRREDVGQRRQSQRRHKGIDIENSPTSGPSEVKIHPEVGSIQARTSRVTSIPRSPICGATIVKAGVDRSNLVQVTVSSQSLLARNAVIVALLDRTVVSWSRASTLLELKVRSSNLRRPKLSPWSEEKTRAVDRF